MTAQHRSDEEQRAFIWRNGVLRIGLPAALIMASLGGLMMYAAWTTFDWRVFAVYALLTIIVFAPVFGRYWGMRLWERRRLE